MINNWMVISLQSIISMNNKLVPLIATGFTSFMEYIPSHNLIYVGLFLLPTGASSDEL